MFLEYQVCELVKKYVYERVIPIAILKLESVSVIQRDNILIFLLFSIVYKTFLVSILLLKIKSNTILKK